MGLEVTPIMSAEYCLEHHPVLVGLVGIADRCYRCGKPNRAIAGVIVEKSDAMAYLGLDDDVFLDFDSVAEALRDALDPAWLKERQVGPLKVRRSRQRPEGYLSNGCVWCDTILGSFPLSEAVGEIGMDRLADHVFAHVALPLDALSQVVGPLLGAGGCGPDCDCGANDER
ncbi:MAG: hypothetical protein M0027_12665 [Candidatus Dormibacteraeota bacterium]|nr:hypothetical protein [Candidatus Dormibacteraeota bacterium]